MKNPLAGLEVFVSDPSFRSASGPGNAWHTAIETTRRLRDLVQEVTAVLRDEADGRADYAVPLRELAAALLTRLRPVAEAATVRLECGTIADGALVAQYGQPW